MYFPRTPGTKSDPEKRWDLPYRIFFACGACHILTFAFLERYGTPETYAMWLKPADGFTGNHIVAATSAWVFDYHGYSERGRFLEHTFKRATKRWPGWEATLIRLPPHALISESASQQKGLWLREPTQFLHDAMPRAHSFLERFPPPPKER
jgi:hypothetical protein